MDDIKANTCPYCGARYGLTWGGCEKQCRQMLLHQELVQDAVDAEMAEIDELLKRNELERILHRNN